MRTKLKIFSVVIFVSLLYSFILGMLLRNFPTDFVYGKNGTELTIIMYHSILKDTSVSGKYIVTPDELENDIKYLKNNGYTFVSAQEVIDYAESGSLLPDKAVMLTFDDGHYNFYGYVLPLLEKHGINAVVSVVGSYTDEYSESNIKNMSYGYLRWSEIYDLVLSSRVEIGNHSYDFHSNKNGRNGSMKKNGESLAAYKQIFANDTQKLQNRFMTKTGFTPIIYTYPFGAYTEETTEWLKDMGFKMSLSCTEGVNLITHDPNSLFLLKRYNRPSGISTERYFKRIFDK